MSVGVWLITFWRWEALEFWLLTGPGGEEMALCQALAAIPFRWRPSAAGTGEVLGVFAGTAWVLADTAVVLLLLSL